MVWAYNDGLRLAPLPVLAAASRHTYFLQRLHVRCLHCQPCMCEHTCAQQLMVTAWGILMPLVQRMCQQQALTQHAAIDWCGGTWISACSGRDATTIIA